MGSGQAALRPNVPDGGERGPHDSLRCSHPSLKRLPVRGLAGPKPDGDAVGQQTLDNASVEGDQDGRGERDFPHPAQEVQALLCLLRQGGGVEGPG